MPLSMPRLEPCDSLYLSPHPDDVPRACAARLASELQRGDEVLVVTVFGSAPPPWPAVASSPGGVRQVALEIPPAPQRNPYYSSFAALTEGQHPDDEAWMNQAAELLNDIRHRTKARQVYVPLGVGSHIDHRLCHDAALKVFSSGDGRNVFLYEERPEALVPGAVRVRLGELGARLPPAAAEAAHGTSLAPFLMRFHVAAQARGDLKGWPERLRSTGLAARQWRQGRGWHPQKGFGPRLQPVVQHAAPDLADAVKEMQSAIPGLTESRRANERLSRLSAGYAAGLGSASHAERYWLLLPRREEDGLAAMPLPTGAVSSAAPSKLPPTG
jgi:LmbE family N-acetylglucosaminyl deacetylase